MIPGFNTDLTHDGVDHHIQTEDLGEKNPVILTLVYAHGAIILRQQLDYRELLGTRPSAAVIKALMEAQHQKILRKVSAGEIPADVSAVDPPAHDPIRQSGSGSEAAPKSVESLIEEYLRTRQRTRPQ